MIPRYPKFSPVALQMRRQLHPRFASLEDGISEFTFANIYLFRKEHDYKISLLDDRLIVIAGNENRHPFFMLPFGLPGKALLAELFNSFDQMKCVSESQAPLLLKMGYKVMEDRDNFDYLYLREDLAELPGSKYHKKRSLIRAFIDNYSYEGKPLTRQYAEEAMSIIRAWRDERGIEGDYSAAVEAVKEMERLQLCGGIYFVEGKAAAYSLGEETACGKMFAIHFEKALSGYKGLYQFVNQSFASLLPKKYRLINREQDLGDEGLRQAKMTYRPVGFLKKYRTELVKGTANKMDRGSSAAGAVS